MVNGVVLFVNSQHSQSFSNNAIKLSIKYQSIAKICQWIDLSPIAESEGRPVSGIMEIVAATMDEGIFFLFFEDQIMFSELLRYTTVTRKKQLYVVLQ